MIENIIYALVSSIIVSLVAVIGTVPLLLKKNISKRILTLLLSVSVGTLLGSVFIQLLPESIENGYTLDIPYFLIIGFLVFFILEKFIHSRHGNQHDECAHSHGYSLGLVNIIGDGIHNFIDGLLIGSAYLISIPLGIGATVSIALHELPQEIADFGILLYSGFSKKRALFYNFLSAITAIAGTIVGLILSTKLTNFNHFILPFTAGVFLYIGASNLLPELHRKCNLKEGYLHFFAILFGFSLIALIAIYGPGHVHA